MKSMDRELSVEEVGGGFVLVIATHGEKHLFITSQPIAENGTQIKQST